MNQYLRYIVIKGAPRVVISKAGREYREQVIAEIMRQFGRFSADGARMAVRIVAVVPDRRARDLDNLLKPMLDALTHAGIWGDDSQIDKLAIERGRVEAPGWLEVTIERIESRQGVLL